jgi:TonB family protein
MSTPTELWKQWEGRVVDEKFPLRQWLGGSDHSAVFLTERTGRAPQKAAVKLIPAENFYKEKLNQENLGEAAQLSLWAAAAKLSHPHLMRLFECGRCQIDGARLLYVVMEYADENLAEILPLRPLSPAEASEMLRPTVEALASLHQSGFVHGHVKPSNIMAVDNQLKISTDGLHKTGERGGAYPPSAYDAPEVANVGLSPAADIWSLGITLITIVTQNEPKLKAGNQAPVAVPETIPQPFREIARHCLQIDPQQRGTVRDILRQIQTQALQTQALRTQALRSQVPVGAKVVEARPWRERPKRWIAIPIVVAALLIAWVGSRLIMHQPSIPAGETRPANSQSPAEVPATQSSAPFSEKAKSAQEKRGVVRGSVLQQVMPDVSQSAQNTIEGRLRVSVQVSVDTSGNVTQAQSVSPGPSKYFANRALLAAHRWKFTPPQVNGRAAASEWVLRFQFRKTSIQVFPSEINP